MVIMDQKRQVAIVMVTYIGGGLEKVTDIIVEKLRRRGYEFSLFVSKIGDFVNERARQTYDHISIVPELGQYNGGDTIALAKAMEGKHFDTVWLAHTDLKNVDQLRRVLPPECQLIYHMHNTPLYRAIISDTNPFFGRHKPFREAKWFITKHLKEKLFKVYTRRALKRIRGMAEEVDRYIVLCEKDVYVMQKFFPDLSDKFDYVLNPIPQVTVAKNQMQKQKEVLFLGRLNLTEKRPDRLLKIWSKVCRNHPDWKLKFVGNGPNEQQIKRIVSKLGINDSVEFCGYSLDPKQHLMSASILCLTSEYEGFGLVLVEAMQYSVVPMAFNCANGVEMLLQDGRGVLIKKHHINDYARELSKLMTSVQLRDEINKRNADFPKLFDPDIIADRWCEIL